MIQATDIINRVQADFTDKAAEVMLLIEKEIAGDEHIKNTKMYIDDIDRIIRCIIYLANKDMDKLKNYIKAAKEDPRDVIFWAEYMNHSEQRPVHIRDFTKPFNDM
jgi:hypothetical protein